MDLPNEPTTVRTIHIVQGVNTLCGIRWTDRPHYMRDDACVGNAAEVTRALLRLTGADRCPDCWARGAD